MKRKLVELSRKQYFWIILLTLLMLAMHFAVIYYPRTIILDEAYYVNDARNIVSGNATLRAEHPPLGELLIASGIIMFGDNSLGWRFFAVLMGSAAIFLLYLICRRLEMSRRASFLASLLLALENLTFMQSSVAMLDVFSLGFMFLAFWLYLRGNYSLASVAGCLSVLCKMTGGLVFIAIGLHWLITRRDRRLSFALSMLLAPLLFVELLTLFDFAVTRSLLSPLQHINSMLSLSGSITFHNSGHPFASRPWDWIILLKVMPYNYDPDYLAVISPTLWALIIPAVGYMCYKIKKGSRAALFGVIWFACTYVIWIPLDLVTDRLTYVYYFYPAVGSICIGLGIALSDLFGVWERRTRGKLRWLAVVSFSFYLLLHVAVFAVLTPVFARWLPSVRSLLF